MSKLPEALKLADQLETQILSIKVTDPAAAELRRLHAANVELVAIVKAMLPTYRKANGLIDPNTDTETTRRAHNALVGTWGES